MLSQVDFVCVDEVEAALIAPQKGAPRARSCVGVVVGVGGTTCVRQGEIT